MCYDFLPEQAVILELHTQLIDDHVNVPLWEAAAISPRTHVPLRQTPCAVMTEI